MFSFWRKAQKSTDQRYKAKPILTKVEAEFFIRLCKALPGCYIFPKVAVSALLEPMDVDDKPGGDESDGIARKLVDYAIYDAELKLVCVVDLGNVPTDSNVLSVGKNYFKGAGIKTVRCESNVGLTSEQITKTILPLLKPVSPRMQAETYLGAATVQMIYQADPVPSNIKGLSLTTLDELTPNKVLHNTYPHIWQRICLFAPDPKHLQRYLESLTMQDRGETRAGFSIEVLKELSDIKTQNDRFLLTAGASWNSGFVNR